MALYCTVVHVTNLALRLFCTLVVPFIESIAYKFRLGSSCDCNSPHTPEPHERRSRRKKLKSTNGNHNGVISIGSDGKRIKLLLDITVRQVGPQSVDIQESTRYIVEDDDGEKGIIKTCTRNVFELVKTAFNLPSSITLFATSKIQEWSDDIDNLETSTCGGDSSRVKKSPKRRMCRSNYRRIIPFFPFNLLGFSNYSAFQMPILTNSSGPEEINNLNVSANANGKARSKRRRHSSTDGSSDHEFSHLDLSEIAGQPQNIGGHDEVDSDPESETRPISSSSNSESQKVKTGINCGNATTNGKITFDEVVLAYDHDNASNATSASEADSKRAVVGDEIHVVSTFLQELEEAANESYISTEDPDYNPAEITASSSGTTSYESGSVGDSDSYMKSATTSPEKNPGVKENGQNGKVKIPSPLSFKQEVTSTAGDDADDYKTPEEEER